MIKLPPLESVSRSVLAVALACALLIDCGGNGGRKLTRGIESSHGSFFEVSGTHQGYTCYQCHVESAPGFTAAVGGVTCASTSCHAQTDRWTVEPHVGIADYRWDTVACIACHKNGANAFDHAAAGAFPIGEGTTHTDVTCRNCHGATNAPAELECITCHAGSTPHDDQAAVTAAHSGVAQFVYASPNCYTCHPDGAVPLPANHDTDEFRVSGTPHAGQACSTCHRATKAVADVSCISSSCHAQAATDTQHAAVPSSWPNLQDPPSGSTLNYQWETTYCLACHGDGTVMSIASHPSVDHGIQNEDHQPFCLSCHDTMLTSGKTWLADFGAFSCLKCHASDAPN